jgi:hypothetical protein
MSDRTRHSPRYRSEKATAHDDRWGRELPAQNPDRGSGALQHDGTEPELVIDEMLRTEAVTQIHSRNVAYGCYMFLVRRV